MTKIDLNKVKLSGKAIKVPKNTEWIDDNLKLVSQEMELFEIHYPDQDNMKRIGWLSLDKLQVICDFTTHTKRGMIGKSIEEIITSFLIVDFTGLLNEFLDQPLYEVDISKAEECLERYIGNESFQVKNSFTIDNDEESMLAIVSVDTEIIFIQTKTTSVNVGKNGIFVLDRIEDELSIINSRDGINIVSNGKRVVNIDTNGNITINEVEINPSEIIHQVKTKIEDVLSDLSLKFD